MTKELDGPLRFLGRWLPVLGWVLIMMVVTTDLGSLPNSQRLLNPVFRWFNPKMTPRQLYMANVWVRKSCHVAEFAVLAILVWRARRLMRKPWFGHGTLSSVFVVLTTCGLLALFTEFVQYVSERRSASPWDVLINLGGAVLGVGLVFLFRAIRSRFRRSSPGGNEGQSPPGSHPESGP
jgi:Predicted integral membrane protein